MGPAAALLTQLLLTALGILLVFGFAVGLAVALWPALLPRLRSQTDRHISMRRATRPLDVPHNIDRWFYRHHRLYGSCVVILSIALLSFLAFGARPEVLLHALPAADRGVGAILIDTARVVLWGLGVFALIIGVVVFVRPSALKTFETWANRWVTPRRALKGLDREVRGVDDWIARHPRGWGVVIAIVSGICLLALVLHAGALSRLGG